MIKNEESKNKIFSLEELKEILGTTVKQDDSNKLICFLLMLNTYTDEDQTNIGFISPSSTGKSYIPLELANGYFPEKDVSRFGYVTPQSFFHENGVTLPDPQDNTGKRKIKIIDLSKKIIIFMDQPHPDLLTRLRSLLSHDKKIIVNKIVDKTQNSGFRTKTVHIRGYPTVIFCSANYKIDEQEKTRLFLLSPEVSDEKLRESISLKIEYESNRQQFKEKLKSDPRRIALAEHVKNIKANNFKQVTIPPEIQTEISKEFLFNRHALLARHQRDVRRLIAIIKAHALFNYKMRKRLENDERILLATNEDVQNGILLYKEISEANELGLTPDVLNIYNKIVAPLLVDGFTRTDFQNKHFKTYRQPIGTKKTKEILNQLEAAGLIVETKDCTDLRLIKYIAPRGGVLSPEQRILVYDDEIGLATMDFCKLCKKRRPVFRIDTEAFYSKPILLCEACFETAKQLDELRGITYKDEKREVEQAEFI